MKKTIVVERKKGEQDPNKRFNNRIFKDGKEVYNFDELNERSKRPKHPKFKNPTRPFKPPRPPRTIRFEDDYKMKTKMFTSKIDLVNFVNEVGEEGNKIDIFKIEDGLYKVVIFEKNELEIEDIIKEHEIEVEEFDIDEEDMDIDIEIEER